MHQYSKIKTSLSLNNEISCQDLHITGDAYQNSIIESNHLRIDGLTQEDSVQYTRFAQINQHSGLLRCHEATIAHLCNGEIHATKVHVDICEGGTIYAQDVSIGTITKPVTVIASHSISVKTAQTTGSTFKINYHEVPIINSKIDLIKDDIEQLKEDLEDAKKHNMTKISNIASQIDILNEEYQMILDAYKTATISFDNPVEKNNIIIFTIDVNHEVAFTTSKQQYSPFFLHINDHKITLNPTTIATEF